jgi:ribosomal protein S18 acetylase RimI-like enzyme
MVGTRAFVRELGKEDVDQTLEFLNGVFSGWGGYSQWFWKFRAVKVVAERGSISFVVEHDGRIVGHLAYVPMNVRLFGKVVPGCQLVDGAIEVRYRGKGIYTNLVRTVLTQAEEKTDGLIFGFANEAAFRNYCKHGDLLALCRLVKMLKVLSFRHILGSFRVRLVEREAEQSRKHLSSTTRSAKRNPLVILRQIAEIVPILACASFLRQGPGSLGKDKTANMKSGLAVVETRDFNRIEKLWIGFSKQTSFAVERNSSFLEWRYSRPETKYKIFIVEKSGFSIGYFVIGQKEKSLSMGNIELARIRVGYIMDLVSTTEMAGLLLLIAERELKKQNCLIAQFWTREQSVTHNMLSSSGYGQLPDEITMVAKPHACHYEKLLLNNLEGITVSLGDTDHA